jgi:class 3 adenylate cyclase/tetratricopeptide (TPR) repeat protein
VVVCANCGQGSEGDFAFCPHCGAQLPKSAAPREQRRTVTILFCDVTGSTALGESNDPEAFRSLLARYFERMNGIVETHGGIVGKFIGDAVMAVFGMPVAHEDDALRACRSALEMRDALPELGVQARIGINTGEVVSGIQGSLATGDAVNVAARLEQAAQPGEILIGAKTFALVGDTAEVEALEPLELKGKSKPVPAFRLAAITGSYERRHENRFVGRGAELRALRHAWQGVLDESRCELITVLGDAGAGKSRLTMEFLSSVGARVVRGHCVPYGEGITYLPVVEVLKQLDALPSDPAAAEALRSLLRETEHATSAEEIAWAVSRALEEQAPLVVVFDDIQWGEETFLDLIDGVAVLSSRAPLLLLCLARPELTDRRPEWPVALRLRPLPDEEVGELLPNTLPPELRQKITRAAGGNPLFVTEMVAMASESANDVVVPPTLQALMAARLDHLPGSERSVLELGAVEGEVFHRGTVQALSEESRITPHLASLVRKELISPERSSFPGDDAFRFRHLLIRDATYEALPKSTRAELHKRCADWLEERGLDLVEQDEVIGYHLERASRCKDELGKTDPELARRAGDRLAAAGRRALARGDSRAARGLLARSLALTRPLRLDIELELDLCECEYLRSPEAAAAIAESAAERARQLGDRAGEALARVVAADYRSHITVESRVKEVEQLALRAVPLLEDMGNDAGLARAWAALGGIANLRGRYEEALTSAEKVLYHSRLAGRPRTALLLLEYALAYGPRPADEGLVLLDEALPRTSHPGPLLHRSLLLAMLGRFEEAWQTARESSARAQALTGNNQAQFLGQIATLEGDHAAAVECWRGHCDLLERHGDRAALSTAAPLLGRSLCALGRHDEAEPFAQLGRELADASDIVTQALWRQVEARILASRGETRAARTLAQEAVEIAERTDGLNMQGDALCDLAEVVELAGRRAEAAEALERALERYESKKNLAMIGQVGDRLEALREEEVARRPL